MIEQRHFIEANTTNEDDLRLRRFTIRWNALRELKLKALLIFMISIILHTPTHMITRSETLSPKKGRLGPQKEPTSLEKTRKLQLYTAQKSKEPTRLVIRKYVAQAWMDIIGCY